MLDSESKINNNNEKTIFKFKRLNNNKIEVEENHACIGNLQTVFLENTRPLVCYDENKGIQVGNKFGKSNLRKKFL